MKNYERRVLCSAGSILEVWKELMTLNLSQCNREMDLCNLIGTPTNPEYICRRCFNNYQKFINCRSELLEKAEIARVKLCHQQM